MFSGKDVIFINPEVGDKLICSNTDRLLEELDLSSAAVTSSLAAFVAVSEVEKTAGFRLRLTHSKVKDGEISFCPGERAFVAAGVTYDFCSAFGFTEGHQCHLA